MSRIGNKPIPIPNGVTVHHHAGCLTIKGPKGALQQPINPTIQVEITPTSIAVASKAVHKKAKALHGLYRMLLHNSITGVTKGYQKSLQIVGIGYKAAKEKDILELHLGKSHVTYMKVPPEVDIEVETTRGKNPTTYVHVKGINKQLVGQIAAKIRQEKPPEPYITKRSSTQKGIRYKGEQLIGKMKKDGK